MAVDGSFKKQGAIPFKWEIRPGVPKVQAQQPEQQPLKRHVLDCKILHKEQLKENSHNKAFPETPTKLAPPPARFQVHPQILEPRTRSLLSAPRALSERSGFYTTSTLARPAIVYSGGCLPSSPLLRKNDNKRKIHKDKLKVQPESETESSSDLETASQWSLSSRRKSSSSPFRDSSPSSSSFSSHRSSPRSMNDAEWAAFGLF